MISSGVPVPPFPKEASIGNASTARIHITGIVQGVGFRPFVYGLANRLSLTGWVRNTSAGVDIEVNGLPEAVADFMLALREEAPPLSRIDTFDASPSSPNGCTSFEIVDSEAIPGAFQPLSADMSICPDCLRELFDPDDRRYRYPFINCTNCGPRFTIIEDIPYDRPNTTMAGFSLCPNCASEYADPLDRRFHAQPVACPVCGPQVWLEISACMTESDYTQHSKLPAEGEVAIQAARRLLLDGKILAVKGLGGFHLACDAENESAVAELRRRKLRVDKPFALMMFDTKAVERHCFVNSAERAALESQLRPIVLLHRRPDSPISLQVAPRQDTLGVMLPYTPLHYLLLENQEGAPSSLSALVMTSGNLSEEPIAIDNDEARQRLSPLADAFLMHDRPIRTRCDDSVVRVAEFKHPDSPPAAQAALLTVRRSRGYAPFPVRLLWDLPPLLAAGAELKNAFCLTRDRYAFLSQHIGDLENYETLRSFEAGVAHFERLFRITPQALAYDLHPDYLASRYALDRAGREGLPAVGVQHHHAHIAACMLEAGLEPGCSVIGVAFDGAGYGEDGAVWGGEFLIADYQSYRRAAHLAYLPLPGGDRAVREPWRLALAWLARLNLEWSPDLPPVQFARTQSGFANVGLVPFRIQLERGANAPLTSSMGRLFDAVSALAGVCQSVNYEGQAAIELEALADANENGSYPFDRLLPATGHEAVPVQIDPGPLFQSILADRKAGLPASIISARFHNGVAHLVGQICQDLRAADGINDVALSGGVWQNLTLLRKTLSILREKGFTVHIHHQIPTNDGGLALGQAVIAASRLKIGEAIDAR